MRTILVVAAVCAASFAPSASAKEPLRATGDAIVVSHGDLDLADPAGRAILNQRVDAAVARVCRGQMRSAFDDYGWCLNAVRARVLAQSSGAVRAALTNENLAVAQTASPRTP
jgi:UrcA family protein